MLFKNYLICGASNDQITKPKWNVPKLLRDGETDSICCRGSYGFMLDCCLFFIQIKKCMTRRWSFLLIHTRKFYLFQRSHFIHQYCLEFYLFSSATSLTINLVYRFLRTLCSFAGFGTLLLLKYLSNLCSPLVTLSFHSFMLSFVAFSLSCFVDPSSWVFISPLNMMLIGWVVSACPDLIHLSVYREVSILEDRRSFK